MFWLHNFRKICQIDFNLYSGNYWQMIFSNVLNNHVQLTRIWLMLEITLPFVFFFHFVSILFSSIGINFLIHFSAFIFELLSFFLLRTKWLDCCVQVSCHRICCNNFDQLKRIGKENNDNIKNKNMKWIDFEDDPHRKRKSLQFHYLQCWETKHWMFCFRLFSIG